MSTRKILNSSLIVIALLALWVFRGPLASVMHWFSDPQAVTEAVKSSGFWGPTILFVLFVLQVFFAFIPGQTLMVASGYIYGFTGGMLITWISLVTGGQAAFWLARRYGRRFASKWISAAILDRWDKNAAGQGIGFFAITLVLPLFPNDAMCYVAGLGRISSRRFLIANVLGRGLASFITVFVGAFGSRIPVQVWVGIGILILLGFIGWQIAMFTSDQISRSILKSYFRLLHRTYEVQGHVFLPSGPKIIAMNHTPGCDPLYLPFVLEETPHFLLQDGLFTIPLIGKLLKDTEQIPVYRGTERAKDAKEQACSMLCEGKTIAIVPEGKDVPRGQRIPARTGVVRMSIETGAPIIPLGLYAPPQYLTSLSFNWRESPRLGAWQFTGKSYMRFGAAWKPSAQSDIHVQTEELMDRIYSLVAEIERASQCVSHPILNPITR